MWRCDWTKKLWRHTSIPRLETDKRQSTSHLSHLTLTASRPTFWSHWMTIALSLSSKLNRLNGLLMSARDISGISLRGILVAHGDLWSMSLLIMLMNSIHVTENTDELYTNCYLCRRSTAEHCIYSSVDTFPHKTVITLQFQVFAAVLTGHNQLGSSVCQ